MKSLLKFLPIIVFFITYKYSNVINATWALVGVTLITTIAYWVIYKTLDKMMLVMNAMVIGFGALTIAFDDESFLIWKVSIVYWVLSLGMLITPLFTKKTALQSALEAEISAPEQIWKRINYAWIGFFLLCSAINLVVGFNLPFDTWVNFKMFGMPILAVVFTFVSVFYLQKHAVQKDDVEEVKTEDQDKNV